MNAVEICDAVAKLAAEPFDPAEFPYAFLAAYGNKETTLAKLRKGGANATDVPGAVLQRNNIHLIAALPGQAEEALAALRLSPKTAQAKCKFILATDGETLLAEQVTSGEPLACAFRDLEDHFSFFFPLAGITTVKEIKDNPIDVRATGRLNKLYIQLLKDNPDWAAPERRPDLNHFLARLIFCFFAEDTDIFHGSGLFTQTLSQMTTKDGANTGEVMEEIFRAMNIPAAERTRSDLRSYADQFPYVNGGLFSGSPATPRFSAIARSYLLRAGELSWRDINPDIFGSMIQAVADDDERGALGMHYTSVPNILKVLNPLFLDDLRDQLEKAGTHKASLLKLRDRMARIRVFDPACGSGNFLVIAYKEMRAIEAEINKRRGEPDRPSEIPLTNFRGIEIRDFAAEIARLALIIAEFQCDVKHRGPKLALAEFLPLNAENWIVCGNALRLDWTTVCPPTGTGVKLQGDDLFSTPLDQPEIDFQNAGGEVFICGNPPYKGSQTQDAAIKDDLVSLEPVYGVSLAQLDYVCGWLLKSASFIQGSLCSAALVATNSVCQGRSVPLLWPSIARKGVSIHFAHTSFKWSNLAARNAGVTVVILGLASERPQRAVLYGAEDNGEATSRIVPEISPYLTSGSNMIVESSRTSRSGLPKMAFGNMPVDNQMLLLSSEALCSMKLSDQERRALVRRLYGSSEYIRGTVRHCLWVRNEALNVALSIPFVAKRIEAVRDWRSKSKDRGTRDLANRPHQFREMHGDDTHKVLVPIHSSESREWLPTGLLDRSAIITNAVFGLYDAPLWNMALIASRLHLVWIATVCGKLETRYRYSNTLGWNTFPVPPLTDEQKDALTRCAEDILLAREAHFPATIADLYDPEAMPEDLRRAHDRNDETLERIYIGRRFKNDTERLEKLFEMYARLVEKKPPLPAKKQR